jgi:hypothetical protein
MIFAEFAAKIAIGTVATRATVALAPLDRRAEAAVAACIDARNADPKPFPWTKTADGHPRLHRTLLARTSAIQDQCE